MSLAGFQPALRRLAAETMALSRSYRPCEWAAGCLAGGFVLAFHDLPAPRFCEQIDALQPNEPVHLAVIVDRLKAGKSTRGLFAITVDDGVGETVRAISSAALARHWPATFFVPTGYLDQPGGMPFQWLRNVLARLPKGCVEIAGERIDTSSEACLQRLDARLTRVRNRGPREDYIQFIQALVEAAVRNGWMTRGEIAPPPPISWEEVTALSRHSEIRFESHGVTHTATAALSHEQLDAELRLSRDRISLHTGRRCRHFCYPFGSPESIGRDGPRAAARYYDSAVTMSRGRLRGKQNLFLLPRIPLYDQDTAAMTRLKVLTR